MKYYFNLVVNFLLLITTPTLLASSKTQAPTYIPSDFSENTTNSLTGKVQEQFLPKTIFFTYDNLLEFIDEVENGDEDNYTPQKYKKMLDAIVALARAGVDETDPSNKIELEHDIEILTNNSSSLRFSKSFEDSSYIIVPEKDDGQSQFEVINCSWLGKKLSKKWKHVKHFCKKHKKALIVGGAIVLVVAGGVFIAAASSTAASTLGSAGAAALISDKTSDGKQSTSSNGASTASSSSNGISESTSSISSSAVNAANSAATLISDPHYSDHTSNIATSLGSGNHSSDWGKSSNVNGINNSISKNTPSNGSELATNTQSPIVKDIPLENQIPTQNYQEKIVSISDLKNTIYHHTFVSEEVNFEEIVIKSNDANAQGFNSITNYDPLYGSMENDFREVTIKGKDLAVSVHGQPSPYKDHDFIFLETDFNSLADRVVMNGTDEIIIKLNDWDNDNFVVTGKDLRVSVYNPGTHAFSDNQLVAYDYNYKENLIPLSAVNTFKDSVFFEEAVRTVVSPLTHELYQFVTDNYSFIPLGLDALKDNHDTFGCPDTIFKSSDYYDFEDKALSQAVQTLTEMFTEDDFDDDNDFAVYDFSFSELFDDIAFEGHKLIDYVFSTDNAHHFSAEEREFFSPCQAGLATASCVPVIKELKNLKPGTAAKKLITKITGAYKNARIPKTLANNVRGWKVGDQITNLTKFGKVPKWSTVRKRYWKNQAERIKSDPSFRPDYGNPGNIKRMEKGLAPQRLNEKTGLWESMELHHIPPQREGGLFDFFELWPEEHAKLDDLRHLGY